MTKYITEEFDIKVSIEAVSDMSGIATDIQYDPTYLEPIDTDPVAAKTQLDITDHGFLPGATLIANVTQDAGGTEIPGSVVVALKVTEIYSRLNFVL
jgi:hypothetical protein